MTPHLETPKDIATERGEATSEMQLCHVENSTLISHTVAEISVPDGCTQHNYSRFNVQQNTFARYVLLLSD